MDSEVEIVVIGATGLIGETLLQMLAEHAWLNGQVRLLGGESSAGQRIEFGRKELRVGDSTLHEFQRQQLIIFTGEEKIDREWLVRAQDAGSIIFDLSSRLLPDYALPPLVAWVNPQVLDSVAQGGIVALPDAATTQLVSLLNPLLQLGEPRKVSVFSCHAVSELGRSGVEEMARQTAQLLNAKPVVPLLFDKQIAFNLLPMVSRSEQQALSDVESEIAVSVRKLLGRSELNLSVRCCWVPVFFGHSQVVDMQFDRPIAMDRLRELLSSVANITLSDTSDSYPTAVTDASGKDGLAVGRIKFDAPSSTDFSLWTIADNLRFGIAINAVKSAEVLVKDYL